MSKSKCLVILSGGQDSTTCAAIAVQEFEEVHAISFNYGQRHAIELESARAVATALSLDGFEVIDIGPILQSTSPLVSNAPLGEYGGPDELPTGVEPTFVPARNLLFLTIAANRAAALGITTIYTGLCQADFAGYWDCRQTFVDAAAAAMGEAIAGNPDHFEIRTPLMDLSKAESIKLAVETMGSFDFNQVFAETHTCYAGIKGGCGKCHACILRDRGFQENNMIDPIWQFREQNAHSPL
jgi:7-cyano-7-deazaguanine synthase